MADQAVARRKGLIIERRVEQFAREVGAKRTADLHRAHRSPGKSAATDIVDQLAERDAEGDLEQPAVFDIARELDRHGATRTAHTEIGIGLGAAGEDEGDRRERQHVVDDRRLAEQALMRRQRRLGADDAAAAFEAFQQRGLFATDIGTGTDPDFQIEAVAGSGNACAEIAGALCRCDGGIHRLDGVRIFRTNVDVALGRTDRDTRNRHALDHHEGIAFHDHAIGEGAAVALVGVADDVFAIGAGLRHGLPLDAGRKTGAATTAQSGSRDIGKDGIRAKRQRALQSLVAVMGAVILHRARVDDAAAGEGQPGLALEPGNFVGDAQPQRMRAVGSHRLEHGHGVRFGDRAERDAALRGCDLNHRLQPVQAA